MQFTIVLFTHVTQNYLPVNNTNVISKYKSIRNGTHV